MTDSYFITFEDSDENIAMRYADDVLRYQTQLPLALSWSTYSGVADPGFLFNDDEEQSILYPAGTNRTAIQIQTKDRYSGITITVLSGAPSVYVQVSEYFADLNPAFIAAPYTVSGDSGLNDLYLATYTEDTPEFPENYWIPLPGEGSYKIVFPSPVVGNAITVTHSGSSPYKISQILPRKSVQAYDLEVNSIKAYHVSSTLIDTISLQVADSIVVGPDLIGAKSIDGSKIIDGTISGVLIKDGTIIGNKILAGTISGVLIAANTITANKLSVTQLDAVAANMGTLVVNSGISVGTNGYIAVPSGYISAGKAKLDSTGLQIGTVSSSNLPSITDTLRVAGSGTGGNIVGMALYNGAFSATNPQAVLQLDSTNALELEMRAISGMINVNFPEEATTGQFFQVYNADMYLRRSPNPPANIPGGSIYGVDSDDTVRYYIGADQLLLNNNTTNTFTVDSSTGDIVTAGSLYAAGPITTDFTIDANGQIVSQYGITANTQLDVGFDGVSAYNFNVGSTGDVTTNGKLSLSNGSVTDPSLTFNSDPNTGFYWSGADFIRVSTGGVQSAIFGADRFLISNGAVSSPGLQFISDQNTGIYSVSADVLGIATGGAQRASISTTTANFTGKITSDQMGYLTVRRTTDVAITTAGTTITWQSVSRSGIISVPVPSDTITIDNAGYYMFSATFATVANLTSLRMTLARGGANYVSTLHGAGLGTGGGYIFNFNIGFWATAGSTYKVILTPSANTTLNANGEGFAGPSPIMNIFQAIGV